MLLPSGEIYSSNSIFQALERIVTRSFTRTTRLLQTTNPFSFSSSGDLAGRSPRRRPTRGDILWTMPLPILQLFPGRRFYRPKAIGGLQISTSARVSERHSLGIYLAFLGRVGSLMPSRAAGELTALSPFGPQCQLTLRNGTTSDLARSRFDRTSCLVSHFTSMGRGIRTDELSIPRLLS